MAECAVIAGKQIALRRVMQINRMLVREHEFDKTQRIALARRLPDADNTLVFIADDLIAMALGIVGISRQFREKFVLQNRGGNPP